MQQAEMVHLQRGLNCRWAEPVAPSAAISRSVASIISCRSSFLLFTSMALLTPVPPLPGLNPAGGDHCAIAKR